MAECLQPLVLLRFKVTGESQAGRQAGWLAGSQSVRLPLAASSWWLAEGMPLVWKGKRNEKKKDTTAAFASAHAKV